jgi:hypothetical protein
MILPKIRMEETAGADDHPRKPELVKNVGSFVKTTSSFVMKPLPISVRENG